MSSLNLEQALTIIDIARKKGSEMGLKPLTIAVLDAAGNLLAFVKEGGGPLRENVARGKAYGAIGMGMASRQLGKIGEERPMFMQALIDASGGKPVPVPGGVLARDSEGNVMGGVGVSGDTSDNDSLCAVAGIEAVGLVADDG